MTEYLKPNKELWDDVHKVALGFFEALPTEKRAEVFESLAEKKGKQLLEKVQREWHKGDEINTRLLPFLLDVVTAEQASILLRYEIWYGFVFSKGIGIHYRETFPYFTQILQTINKQASFTTKWFHTQKYTAQDIQGLYEAERIIFLQLLKEEYEMLLIDMPVLETQIKRVRNSLEYAVYSLYYSFLDIKFYYETVEDTLTTTEDLVSSQDEAHQHISYMIHHIPDWQIDENNPFAPVLAENLANFKLWFAHAHEQNTLHRRASETHLQDIIENFRQNNILKHMNTTEAEFEMGSGELSLRFSTSRNLLRTYVWKPTGVGLILLGSFMILGLTSLLPPALVIHSVLGGSSLLALGVKLLRY